MKDWIIYDDKPEKKIYYRKDEGFANLTVYLEKVIEAPMLNFMALLAEA